MQPTLSLPTAFDLLEKTMITASCGHKVSLLEEGARQSCACAGDIARQPATGVL